MRWLWEIILALDCLANAVLFGWSDETLSSRAHRTSVDGKIFGKFFKPIINFLFFWQDDHCGQAYLDDLERRKNPPEKRK